ncbi:MAG TPA: MoxR family ATPase [Fimbriimonadales bacterium]|nr:MoxR family ATPase [Fimbriimonadales bacterium]
MADTILAQLDISESAKRIVAEVEKAILGKTETVEKAVLVLFCNGHLLIEDVPGVGKTMLAKSLARAIGGEFKRIQFTPDLLPADITGSSIFNQKDSEFEFRPGPIFGNVVLADEINRATPKTQAALLESMEERQVTYDGITHALPEPFFVIATQNNIELTGTYPLPEAQLDRFFARLSIGYPDPSVESEILVAQQQEMPIDSVQEVIAPTELKQIQASVRAVFVHESVRTYIVDIVSATRQSNQIMLGASPRGSLLLMHAAQAHAAYQGEDYVRPDDVKAMAAAVLAHRVIPRADLRSRGVSAEEIVEEIVDSIRVPVPAK